MPTFSILRPRSGGSFKIRDEADDTYRARLIRFLRKMEIDRFSIGRVWQPLSEASTEALEAAAIEEVVQFRFEWRLRTKNRAQQAARPLRSAA